MKVCTFFGHRNTPKEIEAALRSLLIDLIINKNVCKFYVGNQGNFDHLVCKNLKSLKNDFPYIEYVIVLAYMPTKKSLPGFINFSDTVFPDGLEKTPPRYAVIKRNI